MLIKNRRQSLRHRGQTTPASPGVWAIRDAVLGLTRRARALAAVVRLSGYRRRWGTLSLARRRHKLASVVSATEEAKAIWDSGTRGSPKRLSGYQHVAGARTP